MVEPEQLICIGFYEKVQAVDVCKNLPQRKKKMSSNRQFNARAGRFKKKYEENTASLFRYFPREDTAGDSSRIVRKIIDGLLVPVVDCVNQKVKKNTGCTVSEKAIQSWQNKFSWLLVQGVVFVRREK